jgi:glycosyltransferase involved in cell wall biosynthesis
MRIAFIGQKGIPATYGGVEDFTEKVAVRLAKRGHDVTVYCRPYYTSLSEYKGVRLRLVRSIPTKHLDALSHTLLCSLDSLRRGFDIVVYQALGPSSLCFIPRISGSAKVVTIIHALDWQRKKWGRLARTLLRTAEIPAARFPDKVITISDALRSYLQGKFKREVQRVTPGVEAPVFREPRRIRDFGLEGEEYILYLGRLVPEKGCHYLISAFEGIETDMKLFVGGNGFFSDEYVERLHSRSSSRIVFGGYVSEELKQELLTNAYLYVLPSELEGLPQSVVEALSYGRCVLVSDIPANLESCGECGYTFRNKNVADLRRKLTELIDNRDLVKRDEEVRKEYVRTNFSWDRAADDLERIFNECLGRVSHVAITETEGERRPERGSRLKERTEELQLHR